LSTTTEQFSFDPVNNRRLAELCGECNKHLRQIENYFKVKILQRSNAFEITGAKPDVKKAQESLTKLYEKTEQTAGLTQEDVHLTLVAEHEEEKETPKKAITISTPKLAITTRSTQQAGFVHNIQTHAINFAIGPAGTGKTYLSVACAVHALEAGLVQRLVLVRPAVEAGEKLGFLPGDLAEKILPYLRPLYDALYEMLGVERVNKLMENDVIEIAPLAFMRGRTLNNAFIILDEAQNTTTEQMKMFLTRLGFGSTAVITGDITQIDLPKSVSSGLPHAMKVLREVNDVSFTRFQAKDAVRHPIVQAIIKAYDGK